MARKFEAYEQNILDQAGLSVYTYSPGDGVTRYRFSFDQDSSYFACRDVTTKLGIREALSYLHGVRTGLEAASRTVPGGGRS